MNGKIWFITGASRGFGRIRAEAALSGIGFANCVNCLPRRRSNVSVTHRFLGRGTIFAAHPTSQTA